VSVVDTSEEIVVVVEVLFVTELGNVVVNVEG
jgi:hypothetical protein